MYYNRGKVRGIAILLICLFSLAAMSGCADFNINLVQDTQAGDGLYSSSQKIQDSPEWVGRIPSVRDENVTQVFVVAAMDMDKTTATISMHERDENGVWKQILSTPGFVGRNGLCYDEDHVEGCGQTPIGVYHFNRAFGIADDPGCAISYVQVDDNIYWSGDPGEGMHYNEMAQCRKGG